MLAVEIAARHVATPILNEEAAEGSTFAGGTLGLSTRAMSTSRFDDLAATAD
jgi:hypothetical protein